MTRWLSKIFFVVTLCCGSITAMAQSVDRSRIEKEIDALWAQIKEKEPTLLDTSVEDKAAFAEFLQQSDTGLIRLLPRERYSYKLPINGGGAYYSFALRTHEYGRGSDIQFERGQFSVGFAGYDYGFFISLDAIPLEAVTQEHSAVRAMAEYQPPLREPEIRAQLRQAHHGIKIGEFTAKSRVPAKVGATYLLRSFNYDDSDLIVAFRVVRQDVDESVILLWKLLQKFPTPKSIRENQN